MIEDRPDSVSVQSDLAEVCRHIPHRPPFLWIDRIVLLQSTHIEAEKLIPLDLDLFEGHFPGYPVVPGVILCESVFQAGALLLSGNMTSEKHDSADSAAPGSSGRIPLLTRIYGAKFKRQVRPGDSIRIQVDIKEQHGSAWIMKGKVMVAGKVAVTVEFACTLLKG